MKHLKISAILILFIFVFSAYSYGTWTGATRLTWTSATAYYPKIMTASNYIHIVWCSNLPGVYSLYHKNSTDAGNNWSGPNRLTWDTGNSMAPSIATNSSNHVLLVWDNDKSEESQIYFKKSTNNGTNWSSLEQLTWTSGASWYPSIAVGANNHIHVVWQDDYTGNLELYYKCSTDNGATWSINPRITWNAGSSEHPVIATDSNNNLHLLWEEDGSGNYEIYYKNTSDNGTTWSTVTQLTWSSPGASWNPVVAVDSNDVIHIIYVKNSSGQNTDIFHKKSTDGGINWSSPTQLTWTDASTLDPAICISPNNHIHVVWDDNNINADWEIYYKTSTDGGSSWSLTRLTSMNGLSWYPSIAANSTNKVFVSWQDDAPGNFELYFKKDE